MTNQIHDKLLAVKQIEDAIVKEMLREGVTEYDLTELVEIRIRREALECLYKMSANGGDGNDKV